MPTASYLILDGEVLAETRGGVERDYLPDPLGSVVALLDSSQARTDEFAYWPYGEERARTGTTPTPFRFVGTLGYYRDDAARTYVRARGLRPGLARWQTADPLWPDESAYGYAKDGPTTWVDPDGAQKRKRGPKKPQKPTPDPTQPFPSKVSECISALMDHYVARWPKCPIEDFGSSPVKQKACWSTVVRCLIYCESKFDPSVKNIPRPGHRPSSAFGYMQVLKEHEGQETLLCKKDPTTGKYGLVRGPGTRFDPCENISLGVQALDYGVKHGIKAQFDCYGGSDYNSCVKANT